MGNICLKAENKWCRTSFQKETFKELTANEKAHVYAQLQKNGVRHYNECVDIDQMKRRRKSISRRALEPYKHARFLKRRYHRIMSLKNSIAEEKYVFHYDL